MCIAIPSKINRISYEIMYVIVSQKVLLLPINCNSPKKLF